MDLYNLENNPYSANYPYMVIDKLKDIKSDLFFGQSYKKMLNKRDRLLSNSERADLSKKMADYYIGYACSPIEIRIHDSKGLTTGLVNGDIHSEIPDSEYYNEAFLILNPDNDLSYEIVGTKDQVYGLTLSSVKNGAITKFTAADIPTSTGAIHKYAVDWGILSQGGQGVTIQIDADGDGIFEQNITSDSEFTQEEYNAIKATDAES